jgi:hypothetical protein
MKNTQFDFPPFHVPIRWDFHSEEGDIAFALYRKQQGSELIPIIHFDRVDCDMSTEEGELQCDDTGVCEFY